MTSTREQFDASYLAEPTSGCWLWEGRYMKGSDYGYFYLSRTIHSAHRASWVFHKGHIPDDLWVLHKCDNPGCVNPDHLFLGTCLDNVHDAIKKGRHKFGTKNLVPHGVGEKHPFAKLTWSQVGEMRKMRGMRYSAISKLFGVTPENVSFIMRGLTWKVEE